LINDRQRANAAISQPQNPRTSLHRENALVQSSKKTAVKQKPAGMVCRADEGLRDVVDIGFEAVFE
jgi:hypothetical protein